MKKTGVWGRIYTRIDAFGDLHPRFITDFSQHRALTIQINWYK